MRSNRYTARKRHDEHGSVAIVVAAVGMTLFAFAALAVDAGYLYQSQRGLQAVADAAVMAGLPSLATSQSTAQTNATTLLTANGYTSGVTVTPSASQLVVSLQVSHTSFFASILGLPSKTLHVSSTGQINASAAAMYAINSACTGVGIRIDGGPANISGPVLSNGAMDFATGPNSTTNSSVLYSPSCSLTQNNGNNGGSPAPGAAGPNPFSYTLADFPVANCSFGTNFSSGDVNANSLPGIWASGGPGSGTLNPGIVCSNGNIQLNGTSITGQITMVAAGTVEASGTDIHLTAAPGGHGLVAFSNSNAGDTGVGYCSTPEAISLGSTDWTISGSLYAPNGCISIGGTNINITGSLVGGDVNIHGGITVNSSGGGGSGYYLYQ